MWWLRSINIFHAHTLQWFTLFELILVCQRCTFDGPKILIAVEEMCVWQHLIAVERCETIVIKCMRWTTCATASCATATAATTAGATTFRGCRRRCRRIQVGITCFHHWIAIWIHWIGTKTGCASVRWTCIRWICIHAGIRIGFDVIFTFCTRTFRYEIWSHSQWCIYNSSSITGDLNAEEGWEYFF